MVTLPTPATNLSWGEPGQLYLRKGGLNVPVGFVPDVWGGSDDFTGTDGAAPKTFWAVSSANGGTATIQGNKLRLDAGTTGGYIAYARATLDNVEPANREWSTSFTVNGAAEKFVSIHWRGDANWNANDQMEDGWRLLFRSGATQDWSMLKRVSSVETNVSGDKAFTVNGATINVKVRADGNVTRVKVWSGSEPALWSWSVEDAALAAQTRFAVTINGGAGTESGRYVEFDSVTAAAPSTLASGFVQELGTNISNVNGTTLAVTVSTLGDKPMPGDAVLVWCARDNLAADPATGDSLAGSPTAVTATRTAAVNNGGGAASDGVVGVLFTCLIAAGFPASETLTWTLPSRVGKVMAVDHYRKIASVRGTPTTANGATGTIALVTPAAQVGDIVVAATMVEHAASSTVTGDSDTTNGTWSAQTAQLASGGATTAGIKLVRQRKTVTGAGTQTYNATNSTSTSVAAVAAVLVPG